MSQEMRKRERKTNEKEQFFYNSIFCPPNESEKANDSQTLFAMIYIGFETRHQILDRKNPARKKNPKEIYPPPPLECKSAAHLKHLGILCGPWRNLRDLI